MKTRTACLIIPVNIIAASERKLRPDVLEAFKGVSSRSNKTVKLKFFLHQLHSVETYLRKSIE